MDDRDPAVAIRGLMERFNEILLEDVRDARFWVQGVIDGTEEITIRRGSWSPIIPIDGHRLPDGDQWRSHFLAADVLVGDRPYRHCWIEAQPAAQGAKLVVQRGIGQYPHWPLRSIDQWAATQLGGQDGHVVLRCAEDSDGMVPGGSRAGGVGDPGGPAD